MSVGPGNRPTQPLPDPRPSANARRFNAIEKKADDSDDKALTVATLVAGIPGRILRPTALVSVVLIGAGVIGGIVGKAWAQDQMDARAEDKVARVRESVVEVKADVKQLKERAEKAAEEQAAQKLINLETNLIVRQVAQAMKITPITLPESAPQKKDGGL